MNKVKIQQQLLKKLLENKTDNKQLKFVWGKYDGNIIFTFDTFVLYIMRDDEFLIDLNKVVFPSSDNVKTFLNEDGYKDCYKSDELRIREGKTLAVFKDHEDDVLLANVKLLEYFDKLATYKYKSALSALYVYEDGVQVGVVMPTRP